MTWSWGSFGIGLATLPALVVAFLLVQAASQFLGLFLLGVRNRQPRQHQSRDEKKQAEKQQRLFPFSCGM